MPLLVWAYPEEFKDKATAGQNTANPNEFTFPSYGSFIYWVTKGYAVLDDASFPIIGKELQNRMILLFRNWLRMEKQQLMQ